MPTRFLLIASVVAAGIAAVPRAVPTSAATTIEAAAPAPRSTARRRSTIKSSWRSRCTTRTSRSCATCATSSCPAASRTCASWTSPRRSIPATVHFRSITEPSRVSVLEQNYEYDLLEPDKLLRKYVGRDVTLVRMTQQDGTTRAEEVKAHLLSYNNAPVWQIGNEIVTGLHADHIRFPELPENLYARPTLIWTLDNGGADGTASRPPTSPASCRGTPTTCSPSARDDKAADLDGWVTLTNGSGTAFRNAKLQLVAGDLNRVRQVIAGRMALEELRARTRRRGGADGAGGLLRLPPLHARPQDDDQQQRDQAGQPAGRHRRPRPEALRRRRAATSTTTTRITRARPIKDVVQVYYQFKNEEKTGLGMPMPAGTVRVYQADSKGGVQFVGEDRINHTPKDETLNLKIGNAFDVVAERNQVDFQKIAGQHLRGGVRDHAAQPQGDADHRRSERADRRHVADAALQPRMDQDGRLGGAVHGAGRSERQCGIEVPGSGHLLTLTRKSSQRPLRRISGHRP